jgi:hypothetical protein
MSETEFTGKEKGEKPDQQKQGMRDSKGRFKKGCIPPHTIKKGEVINPGGLPKGTAQPGRWITALADTSEGELRRIARDKKASASKRGAAMLMLDVIDGDDKDARRKALTLLLERTEGKPHQTRDVRTMGVEHVKVSIGERPTPRDRPEDADQG